MFDNLSTFARIRIAVLSAVFVASLAVCVTGPPELPRAQADDSGIPKPSPGECPGFCMEQLGVKNVCLERRCCGEGVLLCDGDERVSVMQVETYKSKALGTCYVQKPDKEVACNIYPCVPSGDSCGAGTCAGQGPPANFEVTVYEALGTCVPKL